MVCSEPGKPRAQPPAGTQSNKAVGAHSQQEGVPKVGEDRGIREQQQDRSLRPDQGKGTARCCVAKSQLLSGRLGAPRGSSHSFIHSFIPPVCMEHQALTKPCWMCWRPSQTDTLSMGLRDPHKCAEEEHSRQEQPVQTPWGRGGQDAQ